MILTRILRLYRVPLFVWHLRRKGIWADFKKVIHLDRCDQNKWPLIEEAYRRIMDKVPQNHLAAVSALEALAEINMRRRNYIDAIPQFEKAVQLNEEQGTGVVRGTSHIFECYGACLFLTEDFERARTAFEKAKELGGDVENLDKKIKCCIEKRVVTELFAPNSTV